MIIIISTIVSFISDVITNIKRSNEQVEKLKMMNH
jgi:hypothetical protein